MPPRRETPQQVDPLQAPPAAPAQSQSTALALPDDVRADLLKAQMASISTNQPLPRVKVMPAGAGLFEFVETTDTVRTFAGIVLNSHQRNVLWDKKYGDSDQDEDGNAEGPACRSNDGRFGIPREGFIHLGLSQNKGLTHETADYASSGDETIECASCPYNQWNSAASVPERGRGGRGKAVTNQKSIYVMVPGQEMPVELVLPPTSIRNFDAYLAQLINRGDPVQSVLTTFAQKIEQKGTLRWAVVTFVQERPLTGDEFTLAMERRQRYMKTMSPETIQVMQQEPEDVVVDGVPDGNEDTLASAIDPNFGF